MASKQMAFFPISFCFIVALLLTSGIGTGTAAERGGEGGSAEAVTTQIKAGKKRCLDGLGPCSIENCNEDCCKKKCNNYYSGLNPQGYCDTYPGFPGRICLCQHDC